MNLLKRITYVLALYLIFASCSSDDDNDDVIMNEPTCEEAIAGTIDICEILAEDPTDPIGLEDCDGDGFNNLTECENGTNPLDAFLGAFENGILVTNEGPFGNGTGTVTFISDDYSTIDDTIFNDVNGSDLGNIVQSMGFSGDHAYIIANNSHKIEVVNRYTFETIATITEGLNNPRYFVAVGTNGYVTNWGDPFDETDDFVAIIDLTTNTVTSTISVTFGPEKIIESRGNIYVAHQGGYSQNSILTIINAESNSFITTIEVGDVPNSMVISEGNLWVLCGGNPNWTGNETNGRLVKIDVNTNETVQAFDFELTEHPSSLTIDATNLIYSLGGGVYSNDTSSASLPTNSIIDGFFYAMTANDGKLYATDAGDFASNGSLIIYDLTTNTEMQTIEVGIIPGGVYFN